MRGIVLFALFVLSGIYAYAQYEIPDIARLQKGKMIQISSFDSTGANNDRINIHAGKTAVILNEEGPGIIKRIWITIDSRDPHFLRRILLKMYWDGEEEPSVVVPVGDFFGTGFEYTHYNSQYLGMSSGGYYCYFPMPFNENARIEVVNETGQEIFAFYYHINIHKLDKPLVEDIAYFHCYWKRDIRTNNHENYEILKAKGKGHLVGVNMSMQPYNGSLWYLEGDEMVYVDGEEFPSTYGTGTEDYFTSGWYFKNGEFAAPYHGLLVKDDSCGRIAAYRHHIPDPIYFNEALRFTIEHGHANEQIVDFSSTAYWYQQEPHLPFPPVLEAGLRIPLRAIVPNGCIEAEELYKANKINTKKHNHETGIHSTRVYGAEWSQHEQFQIHPEQDDILEVQFTELFETTYKVDMYITDYTHSPRLPVKIPMGKIAAKNASATLEIELKADSILQIDAFYLTPVREYIPEWYILGPFDNERESDILRYGLDEIYPPEKEIALDKVYTGKDSQELRWKQYPTPEHGYFSLWDEVKPYEFAVTYAYASLYAQKETKLPLLIGSDDGSKVFLNGEELYRFLDVRIAAPDQDTVYLPLKKGKNDLLLKIENNFGGYAFYARIIDKEGLIK